VIISNSNFIRDAVITIVPDSSTQDIAVVADGDYSSSYIDSLSVSTTITIDFGAPKAIGYIAIGGSNITEKDRLVIKSTDAADRVGLFGFGGDALKGSDGDFLVARSLSTIDDDVLGLDESSVIMYKIDNPSVVKLDITIYGSGTLSIAEIALGDYYVVPNSGEQSGYNRPWSTPNIKSRGAVNLQNAPISLTYETKALKCKLSVPNNLMVDFDGWYKMGVFASSNVFYILEDDNKFHSYACFNADLAMTKAHSKTRSLGVSTLSFNAYAKSTQALLF
jgi:hypothetical protein